MSKDSSKTVIGKSKNLNPVFEELKDPNTFINHIKELTKEGEALPHTEILNQLIENFEPLDFEALAFPQAEQLKTKLVELDAKLTNSDGSLNTDKAFEREREQWKDIKKQLDKLKLNTKHFLVLAIENVLKVAEQNKWGLCKNHDFIYLFNGAYWTNIDKEAFQKFLGEAAEKMNVAKFSARYYQFREQLFKQFLATAYLPTPEPPKDVVFINLKNGTFEINPTGTKLRPFNRTDFITYQLPFDYNPMAKAPLFEAYLNKVLPDKQRQQILAEYLAYVFISPSTLKLEKTLLLYGTGANGKSVFFEIVNALLGAENVSSYSLQSLTNDTGYFRAKLANKLVNYASEINGSLETAVFKQLVSGEPVEARLPYGEPFTLSNYAKLIFNCNALPKDVEHTNAYFRRFLIIQFDVTIPEAEQDKQLSQKIISGELSGVFNWVLEGLNRLLEQKRFTDCEAVHLALEQYQTQSDSVKLYIDDKGYQKSCEEYKLIKELYQDYRSFCMEDGFKPVNKPNFIKRIQSCGFLIERRNIGNIAFLTMSI